MIEVNNLTKRYGDHIAVDNLSFKVEKGQIYGFLGPNGAGKSTTMNIITGYLAATDGTVTINGKDIQKQPEEAKKCIGYLPELPPLYMDMTVAGYLKFVAELKKVPKKERAKQVADVMEMTQITDMKKRLIKNLSKGYRQRVGLAQAILGYPEVLILDEPTVGLDPKQIIEIRELIKKLGESHTIILSSHILSEVSAVCDHIMIIAHGKLVASDSPEGLKKLMSGSMELNLTVKGEQGKIEEVVSSLENVESFTCSASDEENMINVDIIAKGEEDIREEVMFALSKNSLPIMSMQSKEKSLEDIFLELTENIEPSKIKKRRLFGKNNQNEAQESEEDKEQEIEKETQADETAKEPSLDDAALDKTGESLENDNNAQSVNDKEASN